MCLCSTANLYRAVENVSRRTLTRDLSQTFEFEHEQLKAKLLSHVQTGGRISITTDTWSARNYHEFTAITGHWIDESWQHHSTVLDLMKLLEPIHSGEYLAEKLVEITDSLGITGAIFTITRDNATPNDVML
jgi:hypothetical protein